MATILRQVLKTFEDSRSPLSLKQVARDLDIEQNVLEGMLEHWVRKGKLREVGSTPIEDCPGCNKCPAAVASPDAPRRYELVTETIIPLAAASSCKHCG